MNWIITVAGAITVAVTARMVYLFFLSGKTITNATLFGRLVDATEQARREFAAGWREQGWRYLVIAYPCIIASVSLVSLGLYWMLRIMERFDSIGDVLRYCLLVFGLGVSASLVLTFLLIFLVYFLLSVTRTWWRRDGEPVEQSLAPAVPPSGGDGDASS